MKKVMFSVLVLFSMIVSLSATSEEIVVESIDTDMPVLLTSEDDKNNVAKIGGTYYETLEEAINNANEGDVVTLLSDVKENITIKKAIVLDLNSKTISALSSKSVIIVEIINASENSKLVIMNGTITGGNDSRGGGIYVKSAISSKGSISILFDKLNVLNNNATNGGGISISSGNIDIVDSNISDNTVKGSGGSIHINATAGFDVNVNINNTMFNGNKATANGGAIAASSGSSKAKLVLDGTTVIKNNSSNYNGGGVWLSGSNTELVINNVTFDNNKAKYNGGAVFSTEKNSKLIINSGKIINNTAKNGGAIYVKADSYLKEIVLGENTIIKGNSATNIGGGLYLDSFNNAGINAELNGAIYDNTASNSASDIYSSGKGKYGIKFNLPVINDEMIISECNHTIDNWYVDGANSRWNAHSENIDELFAETVKEYNINEEVALRAAHNIYGKVVVKYLEKGTNKELADSIVTTDKLDNNYSTSAKDIKNYNLVDVKGEVKGTYTKETIEVIYYYEKAHGKVITHYVDMISGEKLTDSVETTGEVESKYETTEKSFEYYQLNRVEGNTTGEYIDGVIEVTYYYEFVGGTGGNDEPEEPENPDFPVTGVETNNVIEYSLISSFVALISLIILRKKLF